MCIGGYATCGITLFYYAIKPIYGNFEKQIWRIKAVLKGDVLSVDEVTGLLPNFPVSCE